MFAALCVLLWKVHHTFKCCLVSDFPFTCCENMLVLVPKYILDLVPTHFTISCPITPLIVACILTWKLWLTTTFWSYITGNPKIIRSNDELSSSGDQSKAYWEIQVLRVCDKRKNKDSRNLNWCKHFLIFQFYFCLNSTLHWSLFLLSLANNIHCPFSILSWILSSPFLFSLSARTERV